MPWRCDSHRDVQERLYHSSANQAAESSEPILQRLGRPDGDSSAGALAKEIDCQVGLPLKKKNMHTGGLACPIQRKIPVFLSTREAQVQLLAACQNLWQTEICSSWTRVCVFGRPEHRNSTFIFMHRGMLQCSVACLTVKKYSMSYFYFFLAMPHLCDFVLELQIFTLKCINPDILYLWNATKLPIVFLRICGLY